MVRNIYEMLETKIRRFLPVRVCIADLYYHLVFYRNYKPGANVFYRRPFSRFLSPSPCMVFGTGYIVYARAFRIKRQILLKQTRLYVVIDFERAALRLSI